MRSRAWLLGLLALFSVLALSACGEEASPVDTQVPADIIEDMPEVVFGTHMPMTGAAAVYGTSIVPAIQAYFDYVNETQGGVHGRKIRLDVGDDAYDPSLTVEVVRRLVERDGVFAILNGFGTAPHTAVFRYLEEQGVPDLFPATGARKFTEPLARTRFGYNPDYVMEGTILGRYIAENGAVCGGSKTVENGEHPVPFHQSPNHVDGLGRVVGIVAYLQPDLASVDTSLGLVDVVEVGLDGRTDARAVHGCHAGHRHVGAEDHLVVADAGDLLPIARGRLFPAGGQRHPQAHDEKDEKPSAESHCYHLPPDQRMPVAQASPPRPVKDQHARRAHGWKRCPAR